MRNFFWLILIGLCYLSGGCEGSSDPGDEASLGIDDDNQARAFGCLDGKKQHKEKKEKGKGKGKDRILTVDQLGRKHSIIISEVSPNFGFGDNGENNDYVELFNDTKHSVDLEGLYISYRSRSLVTTFYKKVELQGIVPPRGYFLIAEKDFLDNLSVVPDQVARLNFSYKGGSVALHKEYDFAIHSDGSCPEKKAKEILDRVGFVKEDQEDYQICSEGKKPVLVPACYQKYSLTRKTKEKKKHVEVKDKNKNSKDFVVTKNWGSPTNSYGYSLSDMSESDAAYCSECIENSACIGDKGAPVCVCKPDFLDTGESCINEMEIECLENKNPPENSFSQTQLVIATYTDENEWTVPLCPFECFADYFNTGEACIDEREEVCADDPGKPENAVSIVEMVTSTYSDASGWQRPYCLYQCREGYSLRQERCVKDAPFNGDFEKWEANSPELWEIDSGLSVSLEENRVQSGDVSVKLTRILNSNANTDFQSDYIPTRAGTDYILSLWFLDKDEFDARGRVVYTWYDAGKVKVGNSVYGPYSKNGDTWQQLALDTTAPAEAAFLRVGARVYRDGGESTGVSVYLDNVTVTRIGGDVDDSDENDDADEDGDSDNDDGSDSDDGNTDDGGSEGDDNNYVNANDDKILLALYDTIKSHTVFSYEEARDHLYGEIDIFDGKIECIYSGREIEAPATRASAYDQGINCEHSYPKSQFDKKTPAMSDLHHLFSSDANANSTRNRFDFGETLNRTRSFCRLDSCSYFGKNAAGVSVFEVKPERRGDIARAHFYMIARYKFTAVPIDDSNKVSLGCRDSDACINDAEEAVLRKWHAEDPVDERETERNRRIALIQGNRNPFIDDPSLVVSITNF